MADWLRVTAAWLARTMDRVPFPRQISDPLDRLRDWLRRIHPIAPLVVGAIGAVIAVRLVLWLARIPLLTFWRFFGAISGHDVSRLSFYNVLAQLLAFAIGVKVCYEVARGDR
jgi:hypothetical protein